MPCRLSSRRCRRLASPPTLRRVLGNPALSGCGQSAGVGGLNIVGAWGRIPGASEAHLFGDRLRSRFTSFFATTCCRVRNIFCPSQGGASALCWTPDANLAVVCGLFAVCSFLFYFCLVSVLSMMANLLHMSNTCSIAYDFYRFRWQGASHVQEWFLVGPVYGERRHVAALLSTGGIYGGPAVSGGGECLSSNGSPLYSFVYNRTLPFSFPQPSGVLDPTPHTWN